MHHIRQLFSILLVMALLFAGMPLWDPNDASRDSSVNLEDAILLVRGLTRSAESTNDFSIHMKSAVSVLHMVAGLTTAIQNDNSAHTNSILFYHHLPCLVSTWNHLLLSVNGAKIFEPSFNYLSVDLRSDTPPPRLLLIG